MNTYLTRILAILDEAKAAGQEVYEYTCGHLGTELRIIAEEGRDEEKEQREMINMKSPVTLSND